MIPTVVDRPARRFWSKVADGRQWCAACSTGRPNTVLASEFDTLIRHTSARPDNPAIENADRITIEAWVTTLTWPTRAVVCRKDGSYILYDYTGGFSWYLYGPRYPATARHRGRPGERELGLCRRHL
jgi:hypothetical protein